MQLRIGMAMMLLAVAPMMARAQTDAAQAADVPPAPPAATRSLRAALTPSSVFLQYGSADHVNTFWGGAVWDLPWEQRFSGGRLTTSLEAGFGEWQTHGQVHHNHPFTQLGLTPTLRFYPDAWNGHWFAEAGIGANVIAPAYHTDGKRFSTQFNFGDHIGIGREFGEHHEQEVVLRIEHFSNAGIDHPNPGQNFVQLRWVLRL